MSGLSPTQRTLRFLKGEGRICAIVEKFNQFAGPIIRRDDGTMGRAGIRQDLFGIIDVIALDSKRGVIGIQSCGQAFSEHVRKFKDERAQECIDWLSTPGTSLFIYSWRKVKKVRGGKAMVWEPRIQEFILSDFIVNDKSPTFSFPETIDNGKRVAGNRGSDSYKDADML